MLHLSQAEPVARGGYQTIYRHPRDPKLLIKVLNDDLLEAWRGRGAFSRIFRGAGVYRHVIEELSEQIFVHAADQSRSEFLNPIVGLVYSDLGPGLVTPAIFDAQGRYAPSLRTLARTGRLTDALQQQLSEFEERVVASPVVVNDLNPGNIVYGTTGEGEPRLVLIDGFGEKTLIRLSRMSPVLNRWNKRRKFERLRDRLRTIQRKALAEAGPSVSSDQLFPAARDASPGSLRRI